MTSSLGPAARRIRPFIQNDLMRRIFGQSEGTLDLKTSMDGSEILLFNLSRVGGKLTSEDQQVLGRLLINNLVARAYERDPITATPFYLYVDEVHNFLSGDVPEILSQLRKYGLHLIMAHQYLEQLRDAGDLIYHGVMGTANNKIVFKLNNPEDASIMADRVFAGHYKYTMAKDYKPVVVGHRIRKMRGHAKQDGETSTQSFTNTSVYSSSRAFGSSEGKSEGFSSGEGVGLSLVMPEESAESDAMRAISSESSFSGDSWASMSGTSFANGQSQSEGENSSESIAQTSSRSESISEALEPIIQREAGSYYSLEEQKQIFQDLIIKLPNRHAFAVISNHQKSIPFKTQTVEDEIYSKTHLLNLKGKLYSDSIVHNTSQAVDLSIKLRQEKLKPTPLEDLPDEAFKQ